MESRPPVFQFAKSILARIVLGTIFSLLVGFKAFACPLVSPPVDVDNIFDTTFFTNSFADVWVQPGNPRRFRVSAQYSF